MWKQLKSWTPYYLLSSRPAKQSGGSDVELSSLRVPPAATELSPLRTSVHTAAAEAEAGSSYQQHPLESAAGAAAEASLPDGASAAAAGTGAHATPSAPAAAPVQESTEQPSPQLPTPASQESAEQPSQQLPAAAAAAAVARGSAKHAAAAQSPRNSWPDDLLSTTQLWPGDVQTEDDDAAITREERTLRCWINSVLHRNAAASSTAAAAAAAAGAEHHGLLAHTLSADSELLASAQGEGQLLGEGQAGRPVRSQSYGGSCSGASGAEAEAEAVQEEHPGAGSGLLLSRAAPRSSSAGAASVAAHLSTGADSPRPGVWCGEPAAPGTPTAAAAAGGGGPPSPSPQGSAAAGLAARVPTVSSVSSLFGPELRSGLLLLEILELLQPGCIDWRLANRPPFASRTAQLKALENCQLALKVAQEELGLPLVSMSPHDIVLGRRKIILSLVYQLMRYNTMQMLESIAQQQAAPSRQHSSAAGGSEPSTPTAAAAAAADTGSQQPQSQQLPPSGSLRPTGGRLNIRSSSRKQRGQLAITEQDILVWANSKLQQLGPLAAAAGGSDDDAAAAVPVIRSFRDPALGSGVLILQLLRALAPDLVDVRFLTPGLTDEERQSNARYALSLADKLGCSLFLVWEDLVDPPQPRMVLVLLASLMYQDLQRQQQQPQQQQGGQA